MSDGPSVDPEGSPSSGAEADGRQSLASNATALFAGQLASWALSLVATILLTRHLGPEGAGQLGLATSIWMIAGVVATFGTPVVLTKTFARSREDGQRMLGQSVVIQLLAAAAVSAVVIPLVLLAGYPRETLLVILIVGAGGFFVAFQSAGRASLEGLERMRPVAVAETASRFFGLLVVGLAVLIGLDVVGVALLGLLPSFGGALLFYVVLRRLGISWRPETGQLTAVARTTWPFVWVNVTLVAYHQIDVIVISLLVSEEAVGWYAAADRLFGSLMFVPTVLITALFPVLSRLHAQDPAELRRVTSRSFRLLLTTAVPIGLGALAVATPVVVLLYGESFRPSGAVLATFGVVTIMTYLVTLIGRIALAMDLERVWIRAMVVATAATVALDVMLVPWARDTFDNGALGGAFAYLLTEGGLLVYGLWRVCPWLADRKVAAHAGRVGLAGLAMVAAVWPLRSMFVAIPIAVGVVVYGVVGLLFGVVSAEERDLLRSTLRRGGASDELAEETDDEELDA